MLVLSRKANESITLDCGVEITVVSVNGNRVKLGIKAPDSVHILRTELLPIASQMGTVRKHRRRHLSVSNRAYAPSALRNKT